MFVQQIEYPMQTHELEPFLGKYLLKSCAALFYCYMFKRDFHCVMEPSNATLKWKCVQLR